MKITHKFQLDFLEKDGVTRLNAMQSDANTRVVEVTLLEGGKEWSPAGATASVAFRNLKDGHKGWYDKLPDGSDACTISGNVVTAILAPAVLSGDGEVQAAVVFQDAQLNQLATFGFSILVEKNPAAGVSKANDYYAYSTMEAVSEAVDAMLDSLEDTKTQLGQLVVQVNEAVAQVQQEAGTAIVCEASGEVIAVADASDRALQGLSICGKTTQTGTPSPSNPVPLVNVGSGGSIDVTVAGKNLFGGEALANRLVELTAAVKDESVGTVTFDPGKWVGDAGANAVYAQFKENTVYTIILYGRNDDAASNHLNLGIAYTDGTTLAFNGVAGKDSYVIVSTAPNKTVRSFTRLWSGGNTILHYDKCGIFEGVIAVENFEPYKEVQTLSLPTPNSLPGIPVASGGNYTDSNGQQWICDEIDLARGVYVQRVKQVLLNGTESWYMPTSGSFTITFSEADAPISSQCPSLCDQYAEASSSKTVGNGQYWGKDGYFGTRRFLFRNDSFADTAAWKASLASNPIALVYGLKTPTETPLDADTLAAYAALHSNKPNTTVLNDAGAGQKLGYVADTKLYIDQKFTQLQSAIIAAIGTI